MKRFLFFLLLIVIPLFFYLIENNFSPKIKITKPSYAQTSQCLLKNSGDANCDNSINEQDFSIWKCEYLGNGSCSNPASTKTADFNNDTKVDLVDFEIWRSYPKWYGPWVRCTNSKTNCNEFCTSIGKQCANECHVERNPYIGNRNLLNIGMYQNESYIVNGSWQPYDGGGGNCDQNTSPLKGYYSNTPLRNYCNNAFNVYCCCKNQKS